jgi:hypothetical protein
MESIVSTNSMMHQSKASPHFTALARVGKAKDVHPLEKRKRLNLQSNPSTCCSRIRLVSPLSVSL